MHLFCKKLHIETPSQQSRPTRTCSCFAKNAHSDALFNAVGASPPPHWRGETWGFDHAPPQPAIQSNQAHHSLHALEGVALGDLVRLLRSQLFNRAHHSLHTLEGVFSGGLRLSGVVRAGLRLLPKGLHRDATPFLSIWGWHCGCLGAIRGGLKAALVHLGAIFYEHMISK